MISKKNPNKTKTERKKCNWLDCWERLQNRCHINDQAWDSNPRRQKGTITCLGGKVFLRTHFTTPFSPLLLLLPSPSLLPCHLSLVFFIFLFFLHFLPGVTWTCGLMRAVIICRCAGSKRHELFSWAWFKKSKLYVVKLVKSYNESLGYWIRVDGLAVLIAILLS